MNNPSRAHPCKHQGGYASLGIGVMILFMMTLMTIYLTKSGVMDIRTSADKARHSMAFAKAELFLDEALAYMKNTDSDALSALSWSQCDGMTEPDGVDGSDWTAVFTGANWTCHDVASNVENGVTFRIARSRTNSGVGDWVYFLVATGHSDCTDTTLPIDTTTCTGHAVVRQAVYYPFENSPGGPTNPPPMMGAGNVPLNGDFNVVTNPNGGGPGVPVSIWSKSTIDTLSGTASTCQAYEYSVGNCKTDYLSQSSKGSDIVDGDTTNFPDDLFQYVFGIASSNYTSLKYSAKVTNVSDCSNLSALAASDGNPATVPIVWVTGNCTIPSNTTIGADTDPVVLVVQPDAQNGLPGDFTMNANSIFNGLLFMFDKDEDAGEIKTNGGATFNGSMLSNDATDMGLQINGTFNMIYKQNILDITGAGIEDAISAIIAKIPGSWADYLQ